MEFQSDTSYHAIYAIKHDYKTTINMGRGPQARQFLRPMGANRAFKKPINRLCLLIRVLNYTRNRLPDRTYGYQAEQKTIALNSSVDATY